MPTHQTSATPQPSGGCQTLNFWGVGTVVKAPVWRVQSCMTKQSEERFFPRFLCAGTHFSSATGQKSGRGVPSREEAAQARSLDARRILSIWERRQGSWGSYRFGRKLSGSHIFAFLFAKTPHCIGSPVYEADYDMFRIRNYESSQNRRISTLLQ